MLSKQATPQELAEGQSGLLGNFVRHVTVEEDGHWLWSAALNRDGQPKARDGQRVVEVHRRLYELVIGPIPKGKYAVSCSMPRCVNPFHVKPGEMSDALKHVHQDKCFRGHDISVPEARVGGTMEGACKACNAIRARLYRQRMQEVRTRNRRAG